MEMFTRYVGTYVPFVTSMENFLVILRLELLPRPAQLPVVDDVEAVVGAVVAVYLLVLLLPHVLLQGEVVTETSLAVQTLEASRYTGFENEYSHSKRVSFSKHLCMYSTVYFHRTLETGVS